MLFRSLTPGYMSPEGSWLRSLEERATSWPIAGPAIQEARRESLRQWNRADVERIMGRGGFGDGTEAVTRATKELLDNYDRLLAGHHIQVDQTFKDAIEDIRKKYLNPEALVSSDQEALTQRIGRLRSELGYEKLPIMDSGERSEEHTSELQSH